MVAKPWQQRMSGEAPVEICADGDSDVSDFTAKVIGKRKTAMRKMLKKTKVNLRTMATRRRVYFTLVGKGLNK